MNAPAASVFFSLALTSLAWSQGGLGNAVKGGAGLAAPEAPYGSKEFKELEEASRLRSNAKYDVVLKDPDHEFKSLLLEEFKQVARDRDPVTTMPNWPEVLADRVFERNKARWQQEALAKANGGQMPDSAGTAAAQTSAATSEPTRPPLPPEPAGGSVNKDRFMDHKKMDMLVDGQPWSGTINSIYRDHLSAVREGETMFEWIHVNRLSPEGRGALGIGSEADRQAFLNAQYDKFLADTEKYIAANQDLRRKPSSIPPVPPEPPNGRLTKDRFLNRMKIEMLVDGQPWSGTVNDLYNDHLVATRDGDAMHLWIHVNRLNPEARGALAIGSAEERQAFLKAQYSRFLAETASYIAEHRASGQTPSEPPPAPPEPPGGQITKDRSFDYVEIDMLVDGQPWGGVVRDLYNDHLSVKRDGENFLTWIHIRRLNPEARGALEIGSPLDRQAYLRAQQADFMAESARRIAENKRIHEEKNDARRARYQEEQARLDQLKRDAALRQAAQALDIISRRR